MMRHNDKRSDINSKSKRKKAPIIIAILLMLDLVVTGSCMYFKELLYTYVGNQTAIVDGENQIEYYDIQTTSAEESHEVARTVTEQVADEGMILLKNNGTLPIATSKSGDSDKHITLMGRRAYDTMFGGSGSGGAHTEICKSLEDALGDAGYIMNPDVANVYKEHMDEVPVASMKMDHPEESTYYIGEFAPAVYFKGYNSQSSFGEYTDAAVVVLGRPSGEGCDLIPDMKLAMDHSAMDSAVAETANYQAGQSQLEFNKEERDTISMAKKASDKVVVVINAANPMELGELQDDPDIDAIVWMGYPGTTGTNSLASVLNGSVNPSGHVTDTWLRDLTKDPSFQNFGEYAYTDITEANGYEADSYLLDYEEGIYSGYRYFETAYAEHEAGNYPGFDYDSAVLYPFGYGLSYTSFDWEIGENNLDGLDADGTIEVQVKVTNTGQVAGKEVVQLYYTAPYYPESGIEKAEKVLGAFEKTKLLEPGESETLTLKMDVEDMASYDYKTNQCYVLEHGEYKLNVQTNSHSMKENQDGSVCAAMLYSVPDTIIYGESNPRASEVTAQTGDNVNLLEETKEDAQVVAAENVFNDINEHFIEATDASDETKIVNFTRSNFAGSYPTAPTAAEMSSASMTQDELQEMKNYETDYVNPDDKAPATGQSTKLNLIEMRGLAYDDPQWEELLSALTPKEMYTLVRNSGGKTVKLTTINKPLTTQMDGPAGLGLYGGFTENSCNSYCSEIVTASTWNVDLAYALGHAVGEEAYWSGINGWFAPAVNVHRMAFGGRNFEYYSEDPLLSGMLAASEVSGTADCGLHTFMKHFGLNELDTNRIRGLSCWANEQTMREIYLKGFELAIKEAETTITYQDGETGELTDKTIRAATGVMGSFDRIGVYPSSCCEQLLNSITRDEWGFIGTVLTDANNTLAGENVLNPERLLATGGDLNCSSESTNPCVYDYKNASAQLLLRKATHNILYTVVNSSAMNGISASSSIHYRLAWWEYTLIGMNAVVGLITLLYVVKTIQSKKKENNK